MASRRSTRRRSRVARQVGRATGARVQKQIRKATGNKTGPLTRAQTERVKKATVSAENILGIRNSRLAQPIKDAILASNRKKTK